MKSTTMKSLALIFALAAPATWCAAQAAPAPAKPAVAKAGTTAAKKPGAAAASSAGPKLPPGIPPATGIIKTGVALRYQDIKIGKGALAESNKLYKVHYTGWLAADGKKFDSSFDHKQPVLDKDGKPEKDADGKPKVLEGQPIQFPQGTGRVIPGWDSGFVGMHIGGKRRLFIPYQLAYGVMGRPPVIPGKSDLIFDIELVDISDFPAQPAPSAPSARTMPGGPNGGGMPPRQAPPAPAGQAAPAGSSAPSAPATPPTPPPADKPANPTSPN